MQLVDHEPKRPMPNTAAEILASCLRGEPSGQRLLFRNHRDRVHATLYRILGSNSEIDDLIQETFIQVFRSLHTYRGDAALATWISRITTRVAFAHIRRRPKPSRRLETAGIEATESKAASPVDVLQSKRAVAELYGVLGRLDAKQQIAYALHVIDGRPLAEVAKITSTTVTAAKSRVWRARREVNRRAKHNPLLASYLALQGEDTE